MAKKTASKKTTTRKKAPAKKTAARPAAKSASKKTAASKTAKKTTKKTATKKAPAKKAATKKSVTKKTTKKPAAKKTAAKTASKKTTAKTTTKKAPAKTAAAPASKKAPAKKTASSKPAAKDAPKDAKGDANAKDASGKPNRKGITIVDDRPARKTRPKKAPAPTAPPPGPRLLGPGSPIRKPLIPSGSRAETSRDAEADTSANARKKKTPFNKRQLDKYKDILIAKRRELVGDVEKMETDALRSSSGGLSHTPQHLAEQGSDSADQSLNLNLAAADRRLIKEIDEALKRIADKTYGLCEDTGEPINTERLEELPWTRLSIKAAQRLEHPGGPR